MYKVIFPKNSYVQPTDNLSLKDAIKLKLALEVNRPGGRAVILDDDDYIISTREQSQYIIQNLA